MCNPNRYFTQVSGVVEFWTGASPYPRRATATREAIMDDQIRGLKTEIEENLRGIDENIALRSDGDIVARDSTWNGGCHGRTQPWPMADPGRWRNVRRDYEPADVAKLTGSIQIRHT